MSLQTDRKVEGSKEVSLSLFISILLSLFLSNPLTQPDPGTAVVAADQPTGQWFLPGNLRKLRDAGTVAVLDKVCL